MLGILLLDICYQGIDARHFVTKHFVIKVLMLGILLVNILLSRY